MSRPGQLLVQPSVVRLPPRALNTSALADAFANRTVDQPLLAVFRSRKQDRIYLAYSLDDGRSWTKPLPSSLPNSDSAVQVRPDLCPALYPRSCPVSGGRGATGR